MHGLHASLSERGIVTGTGEVFQVFCRGPANLVKQELLKLEIAMTWAIFPRHALCGWQFQENQSADDPAHGPVDIAGHPRKIGIGGGKLTKSLVFRPCPFRKFDTHLLMISVTLRP